MAAGNVFPVILRNISAWGASCQGQADVAMGAQVDLNFESGGTVTGHVQWVKGGVFGIRFVAPISSDKVFFNQRSPSDRERRVSVSRPATVVVNGAARRTIIRNVSEGGMLLETFCHLRPGQAVEVIAGGYRGSGIVRWCSGKNAGIQLSAPLRLDLFESQSRSARLELVQPVPASPPGEQAAGGTSDA